MKTLALLPASLFALVMVMLPMAAAADTVTTNPTYTAPAATTATTGYGTTARTGYTTFAGDRTAQIIAVIIGVAILAAIIYWATRRNRAVDHHAHTVTPNNMTGTPRTGTRTIR
ncbi:MAG: hypothetical protein LIP23_02575 [Planctomycetes bacterium]|nr:hypothetical protein [Planctomycetota bacterium]